MRILVHTSVWVDHLRNGDSQLASLLQDGSVLHHLWIFDKALDAAAVALKVASE